MTDNADGYVPRRRRNPYVSALDGSARKHLTHYEGGQVRGLNAFTGSYSPTKAHRPGVKRNNNGGLAIMDADGKNLHMITGRTVDRPRFIDWGRGTGREHALIPRADPRVTQQPPCN